MIDPYVWTQAMALGGLFIAASLTSIALQFQKVDNLNYRQGNRQQQ